MTVGKYYTSKNKKKEKWYFVVDIKSGVYDRFGYPIRKQYRKKGFATKKEAQEAERKFLNNIDNGKVELKDGACFKDVINYFLAYLKNEGKGAKGTIANYEGYYKNHMQDLKLVPIKKLTCDLIQSWIRNFYKTNGSDHVYNSCLKLMKRAFNYAIEKEQVTVNPFRNFKPVPVPCKLRKRFSTDELKRIIGICKDKMPDFYCMFTLSVMSGMRVGEYSAIKPINIIRYENCYKIYVENQITKGEYKKRTKTRYSTRIVDISDNVYEVIQWHIKTYNIKQDEFIFRAINGGLIYPKLIERNFKKLLELCDYPKDYCRVHDLRGQYVDLMHLCGVPIEYISRQVGHSNPIITSKVYTQILNELPIEANKKLDNLVFQEDDKSCA